MEKRQKSRDREGRSRSRDRKPHSHHSREREHDNKRPRDDHHERRDDRGGKDHHHHRDRHDDRGGRDNHHRDRNRERESTYGPGANGDTTNMDTNRPSSQRREHKQKIIEPTRIVVLKNLPTLTTEALVSVYAFLSLRSHIIILFIKPRLCLHLLAGS